MNIEQSCAFHAAMADTPPPKDYAVGDTVEFKVHPKSSHWASGRIEDIEVIGAQWMRHPKIVYWIETGLGGRRIVHKCRANQIRRLNA